MYCDNCGTELENGKKFCTKCGRKTKGNSDPFGGGYSPVSRKKTPVGLIVMLAILALIILIMVIYLVSHKNANTDRANDPAIPTSAAGTNSGNNGSSSSNGGSTATSQTSGGQTNGTAQTGGTQTTQTGQSTGAGQTNGTGQSGQTNGTQTTQGGQTSTQQTNNGGQGAINQQPGDANGYFEGVVCYYAGSGEIDPIVGGEDFSYYYLKFDSELDFNVSYWDETEEIVTYRRDSIPLTGSIDWAQYAGSRVIVYGKASDGPARHSFQLYASSVSVVQGGGAGSNPAGTASNPGGAGTTTASSNSGYDLYKQLLYDYMDDQFGIGGLFDACFYSESHGKFALMDIDNDNEDELLLSNDFNWFVYDSGEPYFTSGSWQERTNCLVAFDYSTNECILMGYGLGESGSKDLYSGNSLVSSIELSDAEVNQYMQSSPIKASSYEVTKANVDSILK